MGVTERAERNRAGGPHLLGAEWEGSIVFTIRHRYRVTVGDHASAGRRQTRGVIVEAMQDEWD